MWVSKRKFEQMLRRISRCEERILELERETNSKIRKVAKRILEQPKELLEEINGIEDIEKFINDFIRS